MRDNDRFLLFFLDAPLSLSDMVQGVVVPDLRQHISHETVWMGARETRNQLRKDFRKAALPLTASVS
jgi:hypothetical protein